MELEGKMRKRLSDCQSTDGSEGGHLAKAYLLLDMGDLGNLIDGVGSCILASSTYHTRSRGPPPPPPPSNPKGKGKGKMDNLSGIRKDNATMAENVETSDGRSTPAQNELQNPTPQNQIPPQNTQNQNPPPNPPAPYHYPTPPQNLKPPPVPTPQQHPHHPAQYPQTTTYHTPQNAPQPTPDPQNSTNDHPYTQVPRGHQNNPIYVETLPHTPQQALYIPELTEKDLLIKNMAEELKKLTGRVQNVEVGKGVEGLNYEDLCIQPDVELPEGYKPPKFEMFDGTSDPKVHLIIYYDKLVGVGKNEQIRMKLFMRCLTGDALSWYISQDPKKLVSWERMASDSMDKFRFNTKKSLDVFYIQNLKKKPTETFREYATCWRSEATKVRLTLEKEQMNKFFVRVQVPQYYERLMVIENYKFSDIIKLGKRIEEWIKSGMETNFEALQATNKALQSGDQLYERLKAAGYVTPIPVIAMDNSSQWINPNKRCAYHSGMKGHTIDECRTLKDKIQTLIDTKVIQAKEAAPNVRNNPLPDHRGEGVNVIETDEEWDSEGSIGLIREGDASKMSLVTRMPIVVQTQEPFVVEVSTTFTVMVAPMLSYQCDAIPWDYIAEARRKGKAKIEEIWAAQGMTRIGRVYTPENLGGTSKEATSKPPIIKTVNDDLWRKVQAREYLNKTPAQISILSLMQNSNTQECFDEGVE
ncbi:uncharacterized protein [Nicotiana tomentosiformis]|uniref:uncharacterized protein n=1 Tax=Nicotiana tomentosiformis TaxID=4098 RepID=UPI00388CA395